MKIAEKILFIGNIVCGTLIFFTTLLMSLNIGLWFVAFYGIFLTFFVLCGTFILNIIYISSNNSNPKPARHLKIMMMLVFILPIFTITTGNLAQDGLFKFRLVHYKKLVKALEEGADGTQLQNQLDSLPFWVGEAVMVTEEVGIVTLQILADGSALGHSGYVYSSNGEEPVHLRKYNKALFFKRVNENWFYFSD